MNDVNVILSPAKWIRAELYCKLTGHTKYTLQKNRHTGVWQEGVHYKQGPEGINTLYYNMEEIDKLITKHKPNVTLRVNQA